MAELTSFVARDGTILSVARQQPANEQSPPLILLHGAASNHSRWWHFLAHSRIAQRHRILCPDLRGHGDSLWRGPATVQHWCDDLNDLLDQQELAKAVLVGHCLGANLALSFARRFPQRCAGVVLIEPMLRPALRGRLRWLSHLRPLLHLLIGMAVLANRLGIKRRHLRPVDLEKMDRDWQENPQPHSIEKRFGAPWHDLAVVPSAQYFSNLLQVLKPLPLDNLHCPVLALIPRGRQMTDPLITRRALGVIKDLQLCELEADHWIPTRQPEAMCEAIDDWIEAHFSAATDHRANAT